MSENKKQKQNKSVVVSLRFTETEIASFSDAINKTGLSRSEFFRKLILEKSSSVVINVKDTSKLIYHYNKSGNNLNQLAYKVNAAHLTGIVSEKLYVKVLNRLVDIGNLLLTGLGDDN
ncbi:plasmid mobilization protein [Pectobacterium carotovorum]|uniref:plasmid mobilization protein n=1 Tax=Pectobacterium carotovorum TaxID=554 RepID=UPI0005011932|nr:hypothetical protein [Pectobacterium carotovorum]KFW97766.1 hypothetical protein JV33_20725 [Pectobacterium carotovorum subsp. carotovorum]KML64960.1 hypothetical protein G032_21095 [Pectobacterium carotovorum subsp. carotovorum ICMP 5702]SHH68689.1 hypothetical protein SAMN05444147_11633 [Pectobacterium carotovorum]